jgi:hypothetical protein
LFLFCLDREFFGIDNPVVDETIVEEAGEVNGMTGVMLPGENVNKQGMKIYGVEVASHGYIHIAGRIPVF